jgi:hypothetical protein
MMPENMKIGAFMNKLIQNIYDFEAYWINEGNKNPDKFPLSMPENSWWKAFDKWSFVDG